MTLYENQLLSILEKISLQVNGEISLLYVEVKEKVMGEIDINKPNLISENTFSDFSNEIYKKYNYTAEHNSSTDSEVENVEYYNQKTQEDRYWIIDAKEKNGTIVARKNSERARVPAQSFYGVGNLKLKQEGALYQEFIHVITSRKLINRDKETIPSNEKEGDSYIFLFGKNVLRDEFGEDTIRFYFNLFPNKEVINEWSSLISLKLDDREIPFTLKYLSNTKFYNRTDSGVLYVHKQNFSVVAQVVRGVYENIVKKNGFGKNVPLFTRQLKEGLSFAENPFERKASFGKLKSYQILKGVIAYFQSQTLPLIYDSKDCLKYIVEHKLFDLNAPFLNIQSCYFYDFDIFDKDKNVDIIDYRETKDNNLNAAQYFAKVIESKAIWLANGERTWITYTQKNIDFNEMVRGFRPVNKKEKAGIEFFLSSLNSWLNNKSTTTSGIKIIPDLKGFMEELKKLRNDNEKESSSSFEVSKINVLNGEGMRERFIDVRFPVLNRFNNYEFNPTLTHGLAFYGYLFLQLHDPKGVEKLTDDFLTEIQKNKDTPLAM